jgi:hypothetical protein
MGDYRDFRHTMMVGDEARSPLDLLACRFGATEDVLGFGGLCHLRIGVRRAKALEVETPDVESGFG